MNKKIGFVILGVIVLGGVFYGGMIYGKNQTSANVSQTRQTFGQNGNGNFGGGRGMRAGSGNVFGKIISKDANSITVEMRAPANPNDGTATTGTGSKIVFYTDKTKISKTAAGNVNDLAVGTEVVISGTPNTDGSVNAESVQIRPNISPSMVK